LSLVIFAILLLWVCLGLLEAPVTQFRVSVDQRHRAVHPL
jgi:hypothetical protein